MVENSDVTIPLKSWHKNRSMFERSFVGPFSVIMKRRLRYSRRSLGVGGPMIEFDHKRIPAARGSLSSSMPLSVPTHTRWRAAATHAGR
jgi:hypothetical protein